MPRQPKGFATPFAPRESRFGSIRANCAAATLGIRGSAARFARARSLFRRAPTSVRPFRCGAPAGTADPMPCPTLILTRGARRVAFSPDGQSLVVLRGDFNHKDFWIIDLQTGAERPLAELPAAFVIRDFDISPDGSEIVFDRTQESSELALIDRAHLRRRPVSRSHFSSARCRHASRGRHRAHPNSHGFQLHQPCQTCHLVKPPAAPAAIQFLERGRERHVQLPAERVVRGSRVRIARTVVRGQDQDRGIPVEQIVDTRAYIKPLQRRVPGEL